MDLLTALLACSLHPDGQLVEAIIRTSSGGSEFFVGYVASRPIVFEQPTTASQAAAALKVILAEHGRPLLGLMTVPPGWAGAFSHRVEDLWDTCTNISIGTAKLAEFDYECRRRPVKPKRGWRPPGVSSGENRVCILRQYAAQLGFPPTFVGTVMAELHAPRAVDRTDAAATPSAPPPATEWAPWETANPGQ